MSLDTPRNTTRRPRTLTTHEARQRLEHERNARLAQLCAMDEAGPDAEEQVMAAQRDVAERVLTEIEDASSRIQDGSYGVCVACARPVPVERLEILPYTRFCVPCLHGTG
ncbi:TraR/DksA family transcriptional regulator [Streptomyces sp. NPDC102487]|uniref:TraR/DksA family transcriptional regulator n=1 Tax=Streptomyces sp. NPDC102487 TaxID=3366182 RepID=UPI0037F19071